MHLFAEHIKLNRIDLCQIKHNKGMIIVLASRSSLIIIKQHNVR